MGLLSSKVFTNRYDVEDSINNAMHKTAMDWGQLDRTRYAPMTASTALQGDMYGRSLGYMLGGQDPLMKKQDLIDQLMSKHPDPRTKDDLMAVARDAAGLGLYNVQAQILDIVSEMPDKEKASKAQIESLLGSLRLTQGADPMIDQYLATKVDKKVWEEAGEEAKEGYRKEVRAFFNDIISGYGLFLATQGLQPSDINDMMFTNDGQIKNITMFMQYLRSVSANPFAEWLLGNNDVLLAAMRVNYNGDDTDPPDNGETELADFGSETLYRELFNMTNPQQSWDVISNASKKLAAKKLESQLIDDLGGAYNKLFQPTGSGDEGFWSKTLNKAIDLTGWVGEQFMEQDNKADADRRDAVKKWLGGGAGLNMKNSDAYKHFLTKGVSALNEFLSNPLQYYIDNILQGEYYTKGKDEILGTADDVLIDPERDIPMLWGME